MFSLPWKTESEIKFFDENLQPWTLDLRAIYFGAQCSKNLNLNCKLIPGVCDGVCHVSERSAREYFCIKAKNQQFGN